MWESGKLLKQGKASRSQKGMGSLSSKRMIYEISVPDIAGGPQTGPLGTIAGRGVLAPVVDCPKAQFGLRSVLMNCLDCTKCLEIHTRYIVCDYQPSQQEMAEAKRKADTMARGGGPQPGVNPTAVDHPGIAPPVPPNVYDPKK